MRTFKFKIQSGTFKDIQLGIDYYNAQQKGLGKKFYKAVKNSFDAIKKTPFYQLRYDNIRCLQVKKFPYMVHFAVDETSNTIIIYALINTHLDPNTSWVKTK